MWREILAPLPEWIFYGPLTGDLGQGPNFLMVVLIFSWFALFFMVFTGSIFFLVSAVFHCITYKGVALATPRASVVGVE